MFKTISFLITETKHRAVIWKPISYQHFKINVTGQRRWIANGFRDELIKYNTVGQYENLFTLSTTSPPSCKMI